MDRILYLDSKNVKICQKFKDRLKGMMFEKKGQMIYYFPKCNSIHTFFMFKNIDCLLVDKNNNIIKTYINLKPYRIILPKKKVQNIYELDHHLIENIEEYNKVILK